MKYFSLTLLVLCSFLNSFAQDNLQQEARSAIAEGKQIYRLELANRLADKVFKSKYQGKEKPAGFITYTEGDNTKAIFYNNNNETTAIAVLTFDKDPGEKTALFELSDRKLNSTERQLIELNIAAKKVLMDASTFTAPPGTHLSSIALLNHGSPKCYLLTIADKEGSVVFGNDYLLLFDAGMKMTEKKALHKNLATVAYDNALGSANDKNSSHVHIPASGDMLTSTDVAVLLLNKEATSWSHHTFIGENYLLFWNYNAMEIQAIPKGVPKSR